MMPVNPREENAKLEVVRLDDLDDGEFTAPPPDELDEEDEDEDKEVEEDADEEALI